MNNGDRRQETGDERSTKVSPFGGDLEGADRGGDGKVLSGRPETTTKTFFMLSGRPESTAKPFFILSGRPESIAKPFFMLSGRPDGFAKPFFVFSGRFGGNNYPKYRK